MTAIFSVFLICNSTHQLTRRESIYTPHTGANIDIPEVTLLSPVAALTALTNYYGTKP
jgi:hypothetical protein